MLPETDPLAAAVRQARGIPGTRRRLFRRRSRWHDDARLHHSLHLLHVHRRRGVVELVIVSQVEDTGEGEVIAHSALRRLVLRGVPPRHDALQILAQFGLQRREAQPMLAVRRPFAGIRRT